MTPELNTKLREVRWFPGRQVDNAQIVSWLKMGVQDFGCHVFPEAVEILREYGDLLIGGFHFTPEGSRLRADKFEWLRWEWELNEVLFPIAYEPDGTYTIAVSSTGKIFGSGLTDIFFGNSFEDFLINQFDFQEGKTARLDLNYPSWTLEKNDDLYLIGKSVFAYDSD